ncbi:MAG: rubredoxin [Candidatus Hodarchaeota archaeon]
MKIIEEIKLEWQCKVCLFVYEEEIPFESLPEEWYCPKCHSPMKDFVHASRGTLDFLINYNSRTRTPFDKFPLPKGIQIMIGLITLAVGLFFLAISLFSLSGLNLTEMLLFLGIALILITIGVLTILGKIEWSRAEGGCDGCE